jgi:hypothetical protein
MRENVLLIVEVSHRKKPMAARRITRGGVPTPRPMAKAWQPAFPRGDSDLGAGVAEEAVVDLLVNDKGIWATNVAMGFMPKIALGFWQHAKLPMPVVPLSQQLWKFVRPPVSCWIIYG